MNQHEARKRQLIIDSETNRKLIAAEYATLAEHVGGVVEQSIGVASIASAGVAGLKFLTSRNGEQDAVASLRPSWWQTVVTSGDLAASVYRIVRTL